jgi:TctA family transporter
MLESNFRRSMILSEGDPSVFLRSPVAAVLLLAAAAFPLLVLRRRKSAARP